MQSTKLVTQQRVLRSMLQAVSAMLYLMGIIVQSPSHDVQQPHLLCQASRPRAPIYPATLATGSVH